MRRWAWEPDWRDWARCLALLGVGVFADITLDLALWIFVGRVRSFEISDTSKVPRRNRSRDSAAETR